VLDPVGGFERIKDFFISYVETAFRISDEATARARRELLHSPNALATEPFIEPVLRYESSPRSLADLLDNDEVLGPISGPGRVAFAELALSGLFDGEDASGSRLTRRSTYNPYLHQEQMLSRGIRAGQPGIVTSGTGSGKTESFMLPVLASLANEAVHWPAPRPGYLGNFWWRNSNTRYEPRRSLEHAERPAAVRALILYPMNALVDDQMVRLRKSLDSDAARRVMDGRFSGNRFFFGQYNSATPVTGYRRHPRRYLDAAEKKRLQRRRTKLRAAMRRIESDQDAARRHDGVRAAEAASLNQKAPDQTRYIFPSIDGGEMVSRWDMQAAPPDVLVTNPSMLGAMLSREVEDSIFEKTRVWLESDPDAYFYLVFDELHLIRGSAGTEIAFLIKSLLERLGFNDPNRMHKLRILASSASMPLEGERGQQSLKYLRDLFAPYGTSTGPGDPGTTGAAFWKDCIIAGRPIIPEWNRQKLPAAPFRELFSACDNRNANFIASITPSERVNRAIVSVAEVFGISSDDPKVLVGLVAERAAAVITNVSRSEDGVRATSLSAIGNRAFVDGEGDAMAVRGLLLARALPESEAVRSSVADGTPSFRFHGFVRNIEGLFGAPVLEPNGVEYRDLTVERGTSHGPPLPGRARGRRLFEMLYCEACGDVLLGGQRGRPIAGNNAVEMLPSAADLEGMPEKGATEYYDKMLLHQFAVFWPRRDPAEVSEKQYDHWDPASLDPETGVVTVGQDVPAGAVGGYLYFQTDDAIQNARGVAIAQKTAQPFCCPKCGTDYSSRPRTMARSPIRAFRTGVSKASQMAATELFELLHAIGAEPKSIVFSDSRQDAANQSLEIERLHLRDLRREILVSVAREYMVEMEREYLPQEQREKIYADLVKEGKFAELQAAAARFSALDSKGDVDVPSRKIRLDSLLQFGSDSEVVSRVTSEFVRLGIHPFDEVGRKQFNKKPWWEAFAMEGRTIRFATNFTHEERTRLSLEIVRNQYELVEDVVFSNTFFALEETGLAYPSVTRNLSSDTQEMDAWLRVFAGAYRVEDSKYFDRNSARDWIFANNVPARNRVRRFAYAAFGAQADAGLTNILQRLGDEFGHRSGIIKVGSLYLRIAKEGDPYWRCTSCQRVHLHRGVAICTRCYDPLTVEQTGVVDDLWKSNFLGRRIVRGHDESVRRFRLKCEELTGQTDDFSDRLRRFKDIFVDQIGAVGRLAREIDMLSVTTTMEVGIDIGSLQSIYQANMPPQRFNYQQRVGRAGRRGQAFSFVTTFCRGRSHDAYYFRHPEAITGDPPPAPFLAIDHNPIPLRLLRKVWLRAAFAILRRECVAGGDPYPGDDVVPPDVHGEYMWTEEFYKPESPWPDRLFDALKRTTQVRDRFVAAAIFSAPQAAQILAEASPDQLFASVMGLRASAPRTSIGLAEFFAERGLLPMYGMPTRVRPLYLGLTKEDGEGSQPEFFWSEMSRDLDTAIFEFAPGSVLVKDKQKHRAIGFTGSLPEPQMRGGNTVEVGRPMSNWFGDEAFVARCPVCAAARYQTESPTRELACDDCASPVLPVDFRRYLTPNAFRTDFKPEDNDLDDVGQMALRTIATVLREGRPADCGSVRVHRGASTTVMNLNDGVENEDGDPTFFHVAMVTDNRVPVFGRQLAAPLPEQAIVPEYVGQNKDGRWLSENAGTGPFGLVSRKETDAIYLEVTAFDSRLALDLVAKRGEMFQISARAAAISATHLLVQKAALVLDVAPDEFEVLEPRLRGGRPVLQIADALINGSGLCRRLGESRSDGRPEIIHLAEEIILDRTSWPLSDFLTNHHPETCTTSCYACIQQYQNRRYHGLLDWRLGIAYLRAILRPSFTCGLDDQFDSFPELEGWRQRATSLAEDVAAMRPSTLRAETVGPYNLPCVSNIGPGRAVIGRTIVVHPLWRMDAGARLRYLGNLTGPKVSFVDTFDLERRPLRSLEMAQTREHAPDSRLADVAVAV
jgi:Lhr-like helicase